MTDVREFSCDLDFNVPDVADVFSEHLLRFVNECVQNDNATPGDFVEALMKTALNIELHDLSPEDAIANMHKKVQELAARIEKPATDRRN